ncbi:unnamed protein product [Effrenium voratum]|uniref:Uncharacterized protein n=1 Tax=Effrenium voratum TaxID=2562239 RepID=A0AA36JKJ6_9DINO|nr:unnamed protein product [Effrenium voratum]
MASDDKSETKSSWNYKAGDLTLGFSSLLATQRAPKPLRRPPHITTRSRNVCDDCTVTHLQGLLPAPSLGAEDDADDIRPAPNPGPLGSSIIAAPPCPGGKAARPDTCFMTHRYVKQEIAYLARRIEEVGRYFLALESMIGSGSLGPVLERCLKELEECIQAPESLEEEDVVQGFIDAAVRLGLSPARYKPLCDRLSWLCRGRRKEELRKELSASLEECSSLQQLIDDSVRACIGADEIQPARLRLHEVTQHDYNEAILRAASDGNVQAAEEKLRKGGDCNWQQDCTGYSLWHVAARNGDLEVAHLARSFNCHLGLLDSSGWTALMLASARHDRRLVRELLDAGADPSILSTGVEVIVECDAEQLSRLQLQIDPETRRLRAFQDAFDENSSLPLDLGDQLLAGEELQLPTFLRVSARSALHAAMLRPAADETGRLAVLQDLLDLESGLVNVRDGLGNTALWYAARGGFLGCARSLLHAGAIAALGSSCLMAAVNAFNLESDKDSDAAKRLEDVCHLLMRNGAADCVEEVQGAQAMCSFDLSQPLDLEEALEHSGFAAALAENCLDCSIQAESLYSKRLLIHRPSCRLSSAQDAADFAASAEPEFRRLALGLATNGRVEFARRPTALRMARLARQQQEGDWAFVVGGLEATLILPSIPDVYKALEEIKPFAIRGIRDELLRGTSVASSNLRDSRGVASMASERSVAGAVAVAGVAAAADAALRCIQADIPAVDAAEMQEDPLVAREVAAAGVAAAAHAAMQSMEAAAGAKAAAAAAVDALHAQLMASTASEVQSASSLHGSLLSDSSLKPAPACDLQVWVDCSGCVCLLRLTAARVHEVMQEELDSGTWVLEELASAMRSAIRSGSAADAEEAVLELLEEASALGGLSKVLAIPLQDGWSCTVAGLAAHCGFQHILQMLIDAGAPVSQPRLPPSCSPRGDYSPLSLAIAGQHFQCVSLLVASGADPFEEALDAVVENLSDATFQDEQVMSLLESARAQRLVDNEYLADQVASFDDAEQLATISRLLAYGADPNVVRGTSPLLSHAAAAGQADLVALLLDYGAIVCGHAVELAKGTEAEETVLRAARSRLHKAAAAQDLATIIELVEAGVDPNSMLPERTSLLTFAASLGEADPAFSLEVSAMLRLGADANLPDLAGQYPLHSAVQSGSVDLLRQLDGVDIHVVGSEGLTAAGMAARAGYVQLLEVLLDAGARCSDRDPQGDDVAMLALKAGHEDCVTCLRQRGVLPNRDLALAELFVAVRNRRPAYLEQLLGILVKIYPSIATLTEDGMLGEVRSPCPTLLMEAVRQSCPVMVSALLRAGARMYPRHVSGSESDQFEHCETAWSIACSLSSQPITELLRQNLAQELLFIACHGSVAEMCNLKAEEELGLVANQHDFQLTDESGFGALDHALIKQDLDLEDWFCSRGACFQNAAMLEVLAETVKSCDYAGLERRLRAGADVCVKDASHRTALDWCIFAGFFEAMLWECVESSMQEEEDSEMGRAPSVGSKVTARSAGRMTDRSRKTGMSASGALGRRRPLIPMDPRGRFAPIEDLLISYGARFSATCSSAACLLEPLLLQNFATVQRRCFAGADCTVGGDGLGLAHMALDAGNLSSACALLRNGANPDLRDAHGRTVLWRAVQGKFEDLVDACLGPADLSLGLGHDNDGSLAHLAMECEQPDLALRFLKGQPAATAADPEEPSHRDRVNPDAKDSHGRTVLMRALELKETEIAQLCIQLHANVSAVDSLFERSALHIAAEADPAVVPALLAAGADLDLVDKRGHTPLIAAAQAGQQEAVRALHAAGAQLGPAGSFATLQALEAGHFDLAAQIIHWAGPFDPNDLHKVPRKSSKKSPAKMHLKAAELRAPAVLEAYLHCALLKLGYSAGDFVQRLVQWVLAGDKSRAECLEALVLAIADDRTSPQSARGAAAALLRSRGVPAEVAQLLAEAKTELSFQEKDEALEAPTATTAPTEPSVQKAPMEAVKEPVQETTAKASGDKLEEKDEAVYDFEEMSVEDFPTLQDEAVYDFEEMSVEETVSGVSEKKATQKAPTATAAPTAPSAQEAPTEAVKEPETVSGVSKKKATQKAGEAPTEAVKEPVQETTAKASRDKLEEEVQKQDDPQETVSGVSEKMAKTQAPTATEAPTAPSAQEAPTEAVQEPVQETTAKASRDKLEEEVQKQDDPQETVSGVSEKKAKTQAPTATEAPTAPSVQEAPTEAVQEPVQETTANASRDKLEEEAQKQADPQEQSLSLSQGYEDDYEDEFEEMSSGELSP